MYGARPRRSNGGNSIFHLRSLPEPSRRRARREKRSRTLSASFPEFRDARKIVFLVRRLEALGRSACAQRAQTWPEITSLHRSARLCRIEGRIPCRNPGNNAREHGLRGSAV